MRLIRRSRTAVGVLAAALLVSASGCGTDSPEGLDATTTPATTPATTTEPTAPSTTTTPAESTPPTTDESTEIVMVRSTGSPANSPFEVAGDDDGPSPMRWLAPWDDGFLAIGVPMPAQPLPAQLPPEIAELFPPEVDALFPDGLPPTQQEAIDILEEAGLFETVMQVLQEHPEAQDALLDVERPDAELVAAWSADGDAWTTRELQAPAGLGNPVTLSVYDDRLTVAGMVQPTDDPAPGIVTVASTTDLETWTTRRIEIDVPTNLPEEVMVGIGPSSAAANDDIWAVDVWVDLHVDPFQFLPPDVQEQMMDGDSGLGLDGEGVTVETIGDDGEVTVIERYTWADLGVPDDIVSVMTGGASRAERWSGTWDDPTMTSSPTPEFMSGRLVATSAGILSTGQRVTFTSDGRRWTEITTPVPNLQIQSAVTLGDEVVMLASTPYGASSVYMVTADGSTWTEVEVPGLHGAFSSWAETFSPAFLIDVNSPVAQTQMVVVEHDGFELTQEFDAVIAYQLVDLSTGEVVAEESVDQRTTWVTVDGPFEYLTDDASGVTISDPDTGEAIVQIPQQVMMEAWDDLNDPEQPYIPDTQILATSDGATWLLEDLDDGDDEQEWAPPRIVAANGDTVLVATTSWEPYDEEWQRYSLAE